MSTRYGVLLMSSLLLVTLLMGFLGGVVYRQTNMVQQDDRAKAQPTSQQKVEALTNILGELQAKIITLESMHVDAANQPEAKRSAPIKVSESPHDGRGGQYLPILGNKKFFALFEKKTLDQLLQEGQASLSQAQKFEAVLQSANQSQLQKQAEAQFSPNLVPVNTGHLASRFGYRRDPFNFTTSMHEGLDFAAPTGTPFYAAASGVVETVRFGGDYGLHTVISHENGYQTVYAHSSRLFVKEGQFVQKGQLLGEVGSTGRSTGPHLHFEIHRHEKAFDPESMLNLSYFKSDE